MIPYSGTLSISAVERGLSEILRSRQFLVLYEPGNETISATTMGSIQLNDDPAHCLYWGHNLMSDTPPFAFGPLCANRLTEKCSFAYLMKELTHARPQGSSDSDSFLFTRAPRNMAGKLLNDFLSSLWQ